MRAMCREIHRATDRSNEQVDTERPATKQLCVSSLDSHGEFGVVAALPVDPLQMMARLLEVLARMMPR